MSGTNPVFLVRKAKKSSGQKDAVLWCSDDFEAANATLDYLLIKSGAKLKDYFKAVATNFPVVNELPPEGELSLTFCDYYQLAKDNMTGRKSPASPCHHLKPPPRRASISSTVLIPKQAKCWKTTTKILVTKATALPRQKPQPRADCCRNYAPPSPRSCSAHR